MKLVVFDIDGTLTNTTSIEDQCFYAAFQESFDLDISQVQWHTLPHVTDLGITTHLLRKAWGREARAEEIQAFQALFLIKLTQSQQARPEAFSEVPGALAFFSMLEKTPDIQLAIATGSWSGSARIKLGGIGIDPDQYPFGHSDEFISRSEITQKAIQVATEKTIQPFDKTIYFGDGLWDFQTCASLEIPFIGIDCKRNGRLAEAGSPIVFENYLDQESVLSALDQIQA